MTSSRNICAVLICIAGFYYLYIKGNPTIVEIVNQGLQIVKTVETIETYKPTIVEIKKPISLSDFLEKMKSDPVSRLLTIKSQGEIKLKIDETIDFEGIKFFGSAETELPYNFLLNGVTNFDSSKIKIEETNGVIQLILPDPTLEILDLKIVQDDRVTILGRKTNLSKPSGQIVQNVAKKFEDNFNTSPLVKQLLYQKVVNNSGQEILTKSQEILAEHYSKMIKEIIENDSRITNNLKPKKVEIIFDGQTNFSEVTATNPETKSKVILTVNDTINLPEMHKEIQKGFANTAKISILVTPGLNVTTKVEVEETKLN